MKEYPWHYPRENLAARTFNALVEGPAKALTLFAPRRTGKTEFLTKDLAPCCGQGWKISAHHSDCHTSAKNANLRVLRQFHSLS